MGPYCYLLWGLVGIPSVLQKWDLSSSSDSVFENSLPTVTPSPIPPMRRLAKSFSVAVSPSNMHKGTFTSSVLCCSFVAYYNLYLRFLVFLMFSEFALLLALFITYHGEASDKDFVLTLHHLKAF